jgi:hypothetical protein
VDGKDYEVLRYEDLKCHDTHNKFYEHWFSRSKGVKGITHAQTAWRFNKPSFSSEQGK